MPLEETCVANTFDILHRRAATSYTAYAQKYIGRIQDLRSRLRRWSTDEDQKYADTSPDILITFNNDSYTIAGLHRII